MKATRLGWKQGFFGVMILGILLMALVSTAGERGEPTITVWNRANTGCGNTLAKEFASGGETDLVQAIHAFCPKDPTLVVSSVEGETTSAGVRAKGTQVDLICRTGLGQTEMMTKPYFIATESGCHADEFWSSFPKERHLLIPDVKVLVPYFQAASSNPGNAARTHGFRIWPDTDRAPGSVSSAAESH
jgi:hypothetical protein